MRRLFVAALLAAFGAAVVLPAAAVVGSDFQQLSATGVLRPENWTHGSSAQRRHWLTVGFEDGNPGDCDTFSA